MEYFVSMLSKNDLLEIQKVVKKEINTVKDEVSLVKKEVNDSEERLSSKVDKLQETVDIIQNVMITHHTKLEARVSVIEEKLHVPEN